ncbi:SRPBCC family protein [Sphingorhabdus sp. EL138]|uniref:SRPBCC family protein n=1 Tax=Sphingorhabdus sp. EL138 TaxID=2073156 RepID=UPI000D69878B|nr:SRPBCC family protein [Sphingorhabdus sp. EL138]
MITLINTACIVAPAEEVWIVLSDLEGVSSWVEAIEVAHCVGGQASGVGASRVCELNNGLSIKEKWVEWEVGRSFKYEAVGMPFMKRATNHWSLQEVAGKTLLTSKAEIELKGGRFGRLLEPLMKLLMQSMGPRSLAALAYRVETGKPYQGKHRNLPRVPSTC